MHTTQGWTDRFKGYITTMWTLLTGGTVPIKEVTRTRFVTTLLAIPTAICLIDLAVLYNIVMRWVGGDVEKMSFFPHGTVLLTITVVLCLLMTTLMSFYADNHRIVTLKERQQRYEKLERDHLIAVHVITMHGHTTDYTSRVDNPRVTDGPLPVDHLL